MTIIVQEVNGQTVVTNDVGTAIADALLPQVALAQTAQGLSEAARDSGVAAVALAELNSVEIGLFSAASGAAIPTVANLVRTTGHTVAGRGRGEYVYDVAVDAAYVSANPLTSFLAASGRGFKYSPSPFEIEIDALGAYPGTAYAAATTAALQAAVALATVMSAADGVGTVILAGRGDYYWTEEVSFPRFVDLRGVSKFETAFNAYHADAKFVFGPRGWGFGQDGVGGLTGGFRLKGASLATELLVVGRVVSRRFSDIDITGAAGRGLVLEATQNSLFTNVDVSSCGTDGVTLDIEAGGNLFVKCEFNLNGRSNGRSRQSVTPLTGYYVPRNNMFHLCLFEGTGASSVACFDHGAGSGLVFSSCILTQLTHATVVGTNIPTFWMHRENPGAGEISARVSFVNQCQITGSLLGATPYGYGLEIENSPGSTTGLNVYMDPDTLLLNLNTAIRAGASSQIEASSYVVSNCTTRFAPLSGAHTAATVLQNRPIQTTVQAFDPAAPALIVKGVASTHTAEIQQWHGSTGYVGGVTNLGSLSLVGGATFSKFTSSSRGTAATPIFSFTNDPDCGWFSPGVNRVAVSTNGVHRWEATATGMWEPFASNTYDVGSSSLSVRSFYAGTSYLVGGVKVVGARDTGWTAMTGTGSKGALAAAAAGTAAAAYVQAELQSALDRIAALEARLKSYDAALVTHGLIGV